MCHNLGLQDSAPATSFTPIILLVSHLQHHLLACCTTCQVLWARYVEKNRRDVEEKSEQLKAISTLAALISGFALTAFLQFDFGQFQDTSGVVFPLFGMTMALTVSCRCCKRCRCKHMQPQAFLWLHDVAPNRRRLTQLQSLLPPRRSALKPSVLSSVP